MALAATKKRGPVIVGVNEKYCDYIFEWDSSYPTGGEALPTSVSNEFSVIRKIALLNTPTQAEQGYIYGCDGTASACGTGFTIATTLAMVFVGDNDNVADGPLVEVANATNLSALGDHVVRVWGY